MDEQQQALKVQLDELRAESDRLALEEKTAHATLAEMWQREQAAMAAYRAIVGRQQAIEKQIKALLTKDYQRYRQKQKTAQKEN